MNPALLIPATLGAALIALCVVVNVFNKKATRVANKLQSLSIWGPKTVSPIFVRVMGGYVGVFGLIFFISAVTSIFQE